MNLDTSLCVNVLSQINTLVKIVRKIAKKLILLVLVKEPQLFAKTDKMTGMKNHQNPQLALYKPLTQLMMAILDPKQSFKVGNV